MRWDWNVKLRLALILGATVALFAGLGFWWIPRTDPAGPFMLMNLSHRLLVIVLLVGMAAISGTVGQLWLHRDLPHVGWLVIGVGWMSIAFRSPPIGNALMFVGSGSSLQVFYLKLLGDFSVFFGVTVLASAIAGWTVAMIPRGPVQDRQQAGRDGAGPSLAAGRQDAASEPRDSLMDLSANFVSTAVLASLLYMLVVADSQQRGQVLFALAAGFYGASLFSHWVFPTRSPWGLVLSVAAVAALFYLFTIFGGAEPRRLDFRAPFRVGRPLPIDFLGLALPGAMAGYLTSLRLAGNRRTRRRALAGT